VTDSDLLERLAQHKTLGSAPRRELEWLIAHGTLRQLDAGTIVATQGQVLTEMFVLLSGHIAIYVDRGAGLHKVMEWRAGEVTGTLPYSRMVGPPGNSVTQEPSDVLAISRDDFPELTRECPEVTTALVHKMVDRARVFNAAGLQDERLLSLGKMSAGIAHELNNPASAIERNAALLDERLNEADRAARALGAANLSADERAAIESLRLSCLALPVGGVLSPLEQAAREEQLVDWLEDHGVDDAVALALADTSVTVDVLDRLATVANPSSIDVIIRWAAAACSVHRIATEIQDAATRISVLISRVKTHTRMDQDPLVAEPVDLQTSLGNTVSMLTYQARTKSVSITIDAPQDLPKVRGFPGELNQIWTNLIDNAIDAVGDAGRIDVVARRVRQAVVVSIIDNGPGIPPEVRQRVFEPFFTTKPVGKGTGLGLDIVRRLVSHNDGGIDVETEPGRTEFRVTLPLAEEHARATS
jgi:signal transduction histidine kinase